MLFGAAAQVWSSLHWRAMRRNHMAIVSGVVNFIGRSVADD